MFTNALLRLISSPKNSPDGKTIGVKILPLPAQIEAEPKEDGESWHLCSVWEKDGRRQVARDAAEHVDDGDPEPARQLLYVPEHGHLEKRRHQAVQDPAGHHHKVSLHLAEPSHSSGPR